MKLSQFRHWVKSPGEEVPKCVLTSYAGRADYLMEVEYKHHLEPLKDDDDNMLHFQTMEQVRDFLRPLGIKSITLRTIDPHDEFSLDGKPECCQDDMTINV
ncbi:DUF6482 family protein [Photobacterium sp. WH77]|uniref:Lysyl-tRNA synthetase n=1 Tax=Photobacterium arenosum TaxID=2774143 RepID=A0ABR9BJS9_9GAMM|nr:MULTISPECIES: DUF6482 family protein [Photobacterium]MBD8512790.1 hypothetical protein [Photobacterium arenosum]MBV7261122.1 hypothetical protein [Photobacterium sp. WH24]MCG2835444.1 DUF6482 family protein [Photobacterium sp. WH77]MCG2843057.1 DUF6482 family protein [Photobacterium sp. WH80]MDO6580384.1 DUF6482 family protein [Photobacterium sp. 2_MG-2023]